MLLRIRLPLILIAALVTFGACRQAAAAPATKPAGPAGGADEAKPPKSIFDFGLEPLNRGDAPESDAAGKGADKGADKPKAGADEPKPAAPPPGRPESPKPPAGPKKPERDRTAKGPDKSEPPKAPAGRGGGGPPVTPEVAGMLKDCHVSPDGAVTVDDTITFSLAGTEGKDFVITGDFYPAPGPILYNSGGLIFHLRQLTGRQRYELSMNGMRAKRILLGGEVLKKFGNPMKFDGLAREQWHPFRVEVAKDKIVAQFGNEKGVAPGPLETGGGNHVVLSPGAKIRNLKVEVRDPKP